MKCTSNTYCSNPNIDNIGNEVFCFNCFGSYNKSEKFLKSQKVTNKYQCCDKPNILYLETYDLCKNCGSIHQKFTDTPTYQDDKFQKNILYKQKKVHIPYKYLKRMYPEIKYNVIYDFILESVDEIKNIINFRIDRLKNMFPIFIITIKLKIKIYQS